MIVTILILTGDTFVTDRASVRHYEGNFQSKFLRGVSSVGHHCRYGAHEQSADCKDAKTEEYFTVAKTRTQCESGTRLHSGGQRPGNA